MGKPKDYEPCLPVISILTGTIQDLAIASRNLASEWSDFRLIAGRFVFDETDYYEDEMGNNLFRWWGYRDNLEDPAKLKTWKTTSDKLEDQQRDTKGDRAVNIDPGYIDLGLLVLGSHKNHHQKIYLGDGIYADPVLEYVEGAYRPFHWSFPDFQDDRYYSVLTDFRRRYKTLRQDG